MSDFGDRPLYSQPLRGLRTWKITNGNLQSVTFYYTWGPGVNTASCYKGFFAWPSMHAMVRTGPLPEVEPHDTATVGCTCGFYCFFDGANDYGPTSPKANWVGARIAGLIEGWGTCTVGTKGFRASKAAIRCLITEGCQEVDERVFRNYQVPVYETTEAALADWPYLRPARDEAA